MTNRAWRRARALRPGPDTGRRSRGAAGGCTVGGGVAPGCSAPKAPGQSAPARAPAKDAGLALSLRCRSLCPTARLGDPLPSSQASGARPPTGQRRTLSQPQDTCRAQAAEWKNSAGFGGRWAASAPGESHPDDLGGVRLALHGSVAHAGASEAGKRGQQHQAGPAAAEQGGNDRNAHRRVPRAGHSYFEHLGALRAT